MLTARSAHPARSLLLVTFAVLLAGCFASPDYEQIACQTDLQCAPGYQCNLAVHQCRLALDAASGYDGPPSRADAEASREDAPISGGGASGTGGRVGATGGNSGGGLGGATSGTGTGGLGGATSGTGTGGLGGATSGTGTGGLGGATGGTGMGGKGLGGATGGMSGGGVGGGTTTVTGTGGRIGGTGGASGGSTTTPPGTGGKVGTGGVSGTGGASATGGTVNPGTGGAAQGGVTGSGGSSCTASETASVNASGTGSHRVVVESSSGPDIACGTIYRPADLGGAEKYPIFVWGEGGCSRSGTSNQRAMAEIASHGYFVIADGPPGSSNCPTIASSSDLASMAKPLLGYITWAIAENDKPCSAYYHSLDTTKVAADGFSCGGLMAAGTASDPRMTTWGFTSSGLTSPDQAFYNAVHTPVKILLGGSGDMAYANGKRDYDSLSALGRPTMLFSKNGSAHGGDLGQTNGGEFTKVNVAWLNWQLKGDESTTGKGFLVGASCTFCNDGTWEVKSANLP
jgi:hypothetical protein